MRRTTTRTSGKLYERSVCSPRWEVGYDESNNKEISINTQPLLHIFAAVRNSELLINPDEIIIYDRLLKAELQITRHAVKDSINNLLQSWCSEDDHGHSGIEA